MVFAWMSGQEDVHVNQIGQGKPVTLLARMVTTTVTAAGAYAILAITEKGVMNSVLVKEFALTGK